MGPYVITKAERTRGTVTLQHTIVPTPTDEPTTLVSAISELRIFDDSLAITEYDVPEDRFRQLAYHDYNTRAVNCILAYRAKAIITADPLTDVSNFEYETRFEDSANLSDTTWLPYSAVQHTFAFAAFYRCVSNELTGHIGLALPAAQRLTQQARASAASARRRHIRQHDDAFVAFDADALAFR